MGSSLFQLPSLRPSRVGPGWVGGIALGTLGLGGFPFLHFGFNKESFFSTSAGLGEICGCPTYNKMDKAS